MVHLKIIPTWKAGPNVSQQKIPQSIKLLPSARFLPTVHPGASCSQFSSDAHDWSSMTPSLLHLFSFFGPLFINANHCRPGTLHETFRDILTWSSYHQSLTLVKPKFLCLPISLSKFANIRTNNTQTVGQMTATWFWLITMKNTLEIIWCLCTALLLCRGFSLDWFIVLFPRKML